MDSESGQTSIIVNLDRLTETYVGSLRHEGVSTSGSSTEKGSETSEQHFLLESNLQTQQKKMAEKMTDTDVGSSLVAIEGDSVSASTEYGSETTVVPSFEGLPAIDTFKQSKDNDSHFETMNCQGAAFQSLDDESRQEALKSTASVSVQEKMHKSPPPAMAFEEEVVAFIPPDEGTPAAQALAANAAIKVSKATKSIQRKWRGMKRPKMKNLNIVKQLKKHTKQKRKKHFSTNFKGKVINGEHELYILTMGMSLGIRCSINKAYKEKTMQLTLEDFNYVEKRSFPPGGTDDPRFRTPPHKLGHTFKFKSYAPKVFRRIREYFGVDVESYMMSVCGNNNFLEFISNSKSGQFFFYSHDGKYMIKTQTKEENKFMKRILPHYYKFITENPHTLLVRFLGMHRVKMYHLRRKVHFVIMTSVFDTPAKIHTIYDLKGSLVGRQATPEQRNSGGVLKDMDLILDKRKLHLGSKKDAFIAQIERDCNFLATLNIMDYSLLVGIHDREAPEEEEANDNTTGGAVNSLIAGGSVPVRTHSKTPFRRSYSAVPSDAGVADTESLDTIDVATAALTSRSMRHRYSVPASIGGMGKGRGSPKRKQSVPSIPLRPFSVPANISLTIGSDSSAHVDEAALKLKADESMGEGYEDGAFDDDDGLVPSDSDDEDDDDSDSDSSQSEGDSIFGENPSLTNPFTTIQEIFRRSFKSPSPTSTPRVQSQGERDRSQALQDAEVRRTEAKVLRMQKEEIDGEGVRGREGANIARIFHNRDSFVTFARNKNIVEARRSRASAQVNKDDMENGDLFTYGPGSTKQSPWTFRVDGGINSRQVNAESGAEMRGSEIYFVGVIDILQVYNTSKRLETFFKGFMDDRTQISSVSPPFYAQRFVRFMKDNID